MIRVTVKSVIVQQERKEDSYSENFFLGRYKCLCLLNMRKQNLTPPYPQIHLEKCTFWGEEDADFLLEREIIEWNIAVIVDNKPGDEYFAFHYKINRFMEYTIKATE